MRNYTHERSCYKSLGQDEQINKEQKKRTEVGLNWHNSTTLVLVGGGEKSLKGALPAFPHP